jgi:hypothetical protein
MRYSDKPLVGLIKECEATLCAKNAHRLIDDDAIAERWTSILCSIESCPAGLQKYIGSMTVVSFRRVAVVQVQKVGIARKKGEFLALGSLGNDSVCITGTPRRVLAKLGRHEQLGARLLTNSLFSSLYDLAKAQAPR